MGHPVRCGRTGPFDWPIIHGMREHAEQATGQHHERRTRPLRIGIAVPMANPTVEPELRTLLPADVDVLVTRSVADGDSRARLIAYFENLDAALRSFGGMALDAFGFACTASSYLVEPDRERSSCERHAKAYGFPVVTACSAIEETLRDRGARRLAVASPYPPWIVEACEAHWTRRGFEVIASSSAVEHMADTRAIYDLDPRAAAEHFAQTLAGVAADALLITGTGLPTLDLVEPLQRQLGLPVVTSNRCLARALLQRAGIA